MPRARTPTSGDRRSRARLEDFLSVSMVLVAAVVISWPILSGGYVTYADNPAHLAEIYSFAFENGGGWSDVAFCGFPIGTLHSPLWYGSIAALARAGIPAGALYAFALFFGFAAPSIALYLVARRFVAPFSAGLLAVVFLVQWPSIVGLGSPLAGMWTYFIAVALFVVLVWRLSSGVRSARDQAWMAALVGLIAITHLFAVVPMAILGGVHLVRSVVKRSSPLSLLSQAAAAAAGIVAAAAYWLPMTLASGSTTFTPQNLEPAMALARLVFPVDVVGLVRGNAPALTASSVIGALPMWALIVGGVWGSFLWKRRKSEIVLYAACSSVVLAVLLVFVAPATNARLFGPVSWRLLDFVRIGFAIGAIPALAHIESRVPAVTRTRAVVALAVVATGIAFGFGGPLRSDTPRVKSGEMTEVRELWRWLEESREVDWGRVYVQDTFMTPPIDAELAASHVLALTARETGVRLLGPYYGVVPYKTKAWTMGQVGLVYGMPVTGPDALREVIRRMEETNATHLVVADPVLGERLEKAPLEEGRALRFVKRIGRFSVFRRADSVSEWVTAVEGDAMIDVRKYATGAIDWRVSHNPQGSAALVKASFHPFWRLRGPDGARIAESGSGLIRVERIPPGDHDLSLVYRQPRWPIWVSAAGWLLILSLAAASSFRKRFVPETVVRPRRSV